MKNPYWLMLPKNEKIPGALRAPDCFIFLRFSRFLDPNTSKFFRRASRAGLLDFPKVFQAFGASTGPLAWAGELGQGLLARLHSARWQLFLSWPASHPGPSQERKPHCLRKKNRPRKTNRPGFKKTNAPSPRLSTEQACLRPEKKQMPTKKKRARQDCKTPLELSRLLHFPSFS